MAQSARGVAVLVFLLTLILVPQLDADAVLLSDNYGAGSISSPPYYVVGPGWSYLVSGPSSISPVTDYYSVTVCTAPCEATEAYGPMVTNTIPATVYVGDPWGYVSDKIGTIANYQSPFTVVHFDFTFGLNLTGSPLTCASVGGCAFTYDGSIQDVGAITWDGGGSTTLQFQYNTPEPSTFSALTLGLGLACAFGMRRRILGPTSKLRLPRTRTQ
jgi:hypothetical protein